MSSSSVKPVSNHPFFTVVIAVFNGVRFIGQAIESVIHQGNISKELIIIDGGSSDGTIEIIEKYDRHISFWCSEKDSGIYDAWNKALDHAKGEWIYFLGSDDYLFCNETLYQISGKLKKLPCNVRIAYGQVCFVAGDGKFLSISGKNWGKVRKDFLQYNTIPHQGTFHRMDLFSIHGKFDIKFSVAGDYELLLRELRNNDAFYLGGVPIACMRISGVSNNPLRGLLPVREFFKARKKHKIGGIPIKLIWLYLKASIRLFLFRFLKPSHVYRIIDRYRSFTGRARIWTQNSRIDL
ncbi:MAG: glycosyltransferase [Oligoflexales bacterium]|nr:glycosyltransferase [Oligoflexales bacterium]